MLVAESVMKAAGDEPFDTRFERFAQAAV